LGWFEELTNDKEYGTIEMPSSFAFDYPFEKIKIAFWLWMVSGFEHLPTQDEIDLYDKRWISDMKLAYHFFSAKKSKKKPFTEHLVTEYEKHLQELSEMNQRG
jgi:hypothetical protein